MEDSRQTFRCPKCLKEYNSQGGLTRHMYNNIHEEKPYSCQECFKRFPKKSMLTRHLRTHTGERPYSCPHCWKTFIYSWDLTNHLRIHTEETPHQCSQCLKNFSCKSNLNRHMLNHTTQPPYSCLYCLKKFVLKGHLENHLQLHTCILPRDLEKPSTQKNFSIIGEAQKDQSFTSNENYSSMEKIQDSLSPMIEEIQKDSSLVCVKTQDNSNIVKINLCDCLECSSKDFLTMERTQKNSFSPDSKEMSTQNNDLVVGDTAKDSTPPVFTNTLMLENGFIVEEIQTGFSAIGDMRKDSLPSVSIETLPSQDYSTTLTTGRINNDFLPLKESFGCPYCLEIILLKSDFKKHLHTHLQYARMFCRDLEILAEVASCSNELTLP